jgi:AraC-like DNA-binding protein
MGADAGFVLRPEWVFHIACKVDAFARSLVDANAESSCVERFFASLPPPEGDLERRFLNVLYTSLTLAHGPITPHTRAERARQLVVDEYREPWTVTALARAVGCNRTTLQQEFHRLTGTTVHRFLVQRRVAVAAELLDTTDVKVSYVSLDVGYRSHSAFARHFKIFMGVTPTKYRAARHGSAALCDRMSAE